ncbi:hypothetical protein ACFX11_019360 [Malus domestica]
MIRPWPLAQWGLDLIGPMLARKGKVRYAIVAVDYFTKFGISNAIVIDNGRQFDNNKFRMFCYKFNINLCFASPAHPQSNGQVKAINKIIKRTLKTAWTRLKVVSQNLYPKFFGHTVLRIGHQHEKPHSHLPLVQRQLSQLSLSKQRFKSRTTCKAKMTNNLPST